MNIKSKVSLSVLSVALFLSLCACNTALAGGFGISPISVLNRNLVPGSYYEQTIFLVQSVPEIALNVSAVVKADGISNWIKVENGNNFQIPAGVQQFPMKVSVTVPPDAELGQYKGTITLNTSPAENREGVSVVLGAEIKVDLTVGSIVVSDFSILNFRIPDVEEGSPLTFIIKINNNGNVENGPSKVELTFFDQYHYQELGKAEGYITKKVKSFSIDDVSVDIAHNLSIGSYWADVKIYSGENAVINSKIVFAVVEPSAKITLGFSLKFWWIYLLCAIVAIVIIITAVIFILKKKKKKK